MLTVHKFLAGFGQPDLSPFVFKLETYLRMANIEYRGVRGDARKAPKGKLPYVELDGAKVGDSSIIIERLRAKHGDALDARLSPKERGVGAAFQSMLEEQLYFVVLYQRWQEEAGFRVYTPLLRDYLAEARIPGPLRGVLAAAVRRSLLGQLRAQGTGRHSPGEVDAIGDRIIGAVAEWMGDGPFFFGDEPATIDAIVYAFLSGIMETPFPSNVKDHANARPALVAYLARMKKRYWS